MIKIAIVSSSFPPLSAGGVSSAQYGLLLLLRQNKNFEVHGFSFGDATSSLEDTDFGIHRSGTPLWLKRIIKKLLSIVFKLLDKGTKSYQTSDVFCSAIGSIKAAFKIKKFSPDIVIVSDHGAPMFFIMLFVKAKYIWTSHHNPMRFINNPLLEKMSVKDAKFATSIEKKCIKKCSYVISPSKYMNDFIKVSHNVEDNSCIIPNIIDLDFLNNIKSKEHFSTSIDEYKIFIPSAGSEVKGERYVFSIMHWITNSIKDKKIVFLLSGNISDKLAYEISQQNKIKCVFLGQQEYSSSIAYLKSCDICISPTLFESFGMAILEAMLSGIPVIAFDVGGNRELIRNGENGYIVDYLNITQLCNKAIKLINEPLAKETVVSKTREIYSIKDVENKLFSLITSLGCK